MRYLTIVRHAKATPAVAGASDFDRALSARGVSQCAQLRAWANDPEELGRFGPSVALVSAARRTQQTFEMAFDGTALVSSVEVTDAIYNGVRDVSADALLEALARVDPLNASLTLIAHNPSVLELLWMLTGEFAPEGFKTAGAYVVALVGEERIDRCAYESVTRYVPD
ncbi:MAG TPA: hypothetical protein VMU98_09290 [Acidimicrobiales bacterium]|nr:hypothetical protein [Acidimicrobiales bacterium]